MTVAELIQKLEEMNASEEVIISGRSGEYFYPKNVQRGMFTLSPEKPNPQPVGGELCIIISPDRTNLPMTGVTYR